MTEYIINFIGASDLLVEADNEEQAIERARSKLIALVITADADDFDIEEAD